MTQSYVIYITKRIENRNSEIFVQSYSQKNYSEQPKRGISMCPSIEECINKMWYIYTMEYYLALKSNILESVLLRWMKLEPIIQSEVSQKEKHQYSILMHIYRIQKDGKDNPICKTAKETHVKNRLLDSVGEGKGGMI